MGDIKDFKCTYDNASENSPEIAKKLGLAFPDAYLHADTMAALSKANKEGSENAVCILPFCHTVEAEAMGGIITLGNEIAGPRAKEYVYTNYEELVNLPSIHLDEGRIHEVLLACKMLKEQGEYVVLEVCGPITILNVLIDTKYIFKGMRKNPELMKQVFERLGDEILRYMEEAKKYGVDFISYADSAGGVNILGPKMAEQMVEDFSYEFLKKAEKLADDKTMIMLCPKTTFTLLGTDKAELVDVELSGPMRYTEGCIEALGRVKMVGQQCVKNVGYMLAEGKIKEVVLK